MSSIDRIFNMLTKCLQNNQCFVKQYSFKYIYRKCSKHITNKSKLNAEYSKADDEILPAYDLNQIFDKKLCNRLKFTGHIYIKNSVDAENIASHLCSDWKKGYILEANPGPGILSKAILNNGASHLRIFEKHEEFLPLLKDLSVVHPQLEIVNDDIIFLPSLEAKPSGIDNVFDCFFKDIPEIEWKDGIPLRFFSIISSKKSITFFRYILAALPNKASFFSFGRCEFFLLLTDAEYSYIVAEPKENFATYRWITVLYRLFFEIEHLQKYTSDIFHPLPTRSKKNQFFHLVKLVPKSDIFSSIVNENKLPDFYFFVRRHFMKRTGLVIPTLEGWIPSCGPKLIKEGMHVFTKFGDLSPEQILMLYNQFSSWPEYEDSSFSAACQAYLNKSSYTLEEDNDL